MTPEVAQNVRTAALSRVKDYRVAADVSIMVAKLKRDKGNRAGPKLTKKDVKTGEMTWNGKAKKQTWTRNKALRRNVPAPKMASEFLKRKDFDDVATGKASDEQKKAVAKVEKRLAVKKRKTEADVVVHHLLQSGMDEIDDSTPCNIINVNGQTIYYLNGA